MCTGARERRLDPLLRELGQTRAGWLTSSQFVYSQHCKSCRGLGMPEEKIAAIQHWQVADCFDARERALLAYTDYLVDQRGRVPDAVFDALHATSPTRRSSSSPTSPASTSCTP